MSEKNSDAYQTLGWIINRSESGLFLAVAGETTQQEIVEVYRHGAIGVYDCRQNPGGYSFQELKQWVDTRENISTFFVVNFHLAIQAEQDIDRLNFSRDMLAGLGKNLIFFITAYWDDRLATRAYDFYSFIKIRVIFADTAVEERTHKLAMIADAERERQGKREIRGDAKQQLEEAYSLVRQAQEASDKGDYQESIRRLWKAEKIYEEILGPEHLETASVYFELATEYVDIDLYEEASRLCGKALEIRKKILGGSHPDIAACYDLQAMIYERTGRYREAERLYQRAAAIYESVLGK